MECQNLIFPEPIKRWTPFRFCPIGFAVVADEVRNLPQRSAQAARGTANMITDSIAKTDRGAHLSTRVANGLNEIVAKTRKGDELVGQIALASSEQSLGIRSTTDSIRAIDAITQRATASADENSQAANELGLQVASLQTAAADLRLMIHGGVRATTPAEHTPPAPPKVPAAGREAATQRGRAGSLQPHHH